MALPNTPHQIVIVGGGVAGLEIATQLGRRRRGAGAYQVTLLDRGTAHVWKPMLHMIAAGTRQTALQQTAYLAQARVANFRYEFGALAALDRRQRRVLVAEPSTQAGATERWPSSWASRCP
jgi:NADH dehydrogenase